MTKLKEVKTLDELLSLVKPKSVSVLLEVKEGHTFDDSLANGLNVDKLDKLLWEIESNQDMVDDIPEMETALVYHLPVDETKSRIGPSYAFLDPKINWAKIRNMDLAVIFRLDWNIEVVHIKEDVGVKYPSTLTWAHSL